MKHRFLILCSTLIFFQIAAEEELTPESDQFFYGEIELSAPLSFYTDSWDPNEKLLPKLHGIRVEEKNLVVDLDKAIEEAMKAQDLLRSQNGWLSESNPWVSSLTIKAELYEELNSDEMEEDEQIDDKYEVE